MQDIRKGEIYLANLGDIKNLDIGKVRPVLIFQNNFLNMMIKDTKYKDLVIIPLSTQIKQSDFSYFIKSRDNLEKDSILLCNSIKTIDANRLLLEKGQLTELSESEILDVENIIYNLLGCNNKG